LEEHASILAMILARACHASTIEFAEVSEFICLACGEHQAY
jgi:hypothetical protein